MSRPLLSRTLTLSLLFASLLTPMARAQKGGTWIPVTPAPDYIGLTVLLSDGTVMAQQEGGNAWYRLSPDSTGSYANGTWSQLASMHDTRLYFFTQVLRDGRMVAGGGEYGTGGPTSEIYQPLNDTWTYLNSPNVNWYDGNSEVLPNGNVITAPVFEEPQNWIFNIFTDTWSQGPSNLAGQDESAWVKLGDQSILTIDPFGTNTERLIPSLNQWIVDTPAPIELYDDLGELGPGFLLPNGKAIFFGATPYTAIYTPAAGGGVTPGSWVIGPNMPNSLGMVDAPGAMMPNGNILLVMGTQDTYDGPSWFFEYNPVTNAFYPLPSPGSTTIGSAFPPSTYVQTFLDLPDGTILTTNASPQLYVFKPNGDPLAIAKPTINTITQESPEVYLVTGTLFNGISEGAAYGDDWQMNTNYPIAKITASNGTVFYGRTYGWSAIGVQLWKQTVSTIVSLPVNTTAGTYSMQIIANGVASAPKTFTVTRQRNIGPVLPK